MSLGDIGRSLETEAKLYRSARKRQRYYDCAAGWAQILMCDVS
jgi:hypothetical protein